MPSNSPASPLAAFGCFLVFGTVGTLTGMACAEASRDIWLTSPTPIAGLIPLLAYGLLIGAGGYLRFRRDENISYGILLLGCAGLLFSLLPFIMLVAPREVIIPAPFCALTLAGKAAVTTRWMRLFLHGQSSALARGTLLLLALFLFFVFIGGALAAKEAIDEDEYSWMVQAERTP